MEEILESIRRRREVAMAAHNAEMTPLEDLEATALRAIAVRNAAIVATPAEPEPELTWVEIWSNHPAAEDYFRQFPDDRPLS